MNHQDKLVKFKALKHQRECLQQELDSLQSELQSSLLQIYGISQKISDMRLVSEVIHKYQDKKASIMRSNQIKNEEIVKYKKICADREALVKERVTYIKAFNMKFSEEYDACQKKYQTIDIRDTVIQGIKSLFKFQTCTVFFDNEIMRVFSALHMISKHVSDIQFQPSPYQEEQMACSLGYLGLLLSIIARICGVNLKHQVYFKGSRSYIVKNLQEQFPLHSVKPSSLQRMMLTFTLLLQNLHIIMDELHISKEWRKEGVGVVIGKVGEVLWVDT